MAVIVVVVVVVVVVVIVIVHSQSVPDAASVAKHSTGYIHQRATNGTVWEQQSFAAGTTNGG